jgi:hypothetical protein
MGGTSGAGERRQRGLQLASAVAGSWRDSAPPLSQSQVSGEISALALHSGVAGLVWWRARLSDRELVRAAEPLHQAFRLNTLRAAVQEGEISRAVERLRSVGVEPILGKGWLAARPYPSPGLRPSGDIDFYVPPQDHATARNALGPPEDDPLLVDLHSGFADLGDRAPADPQRRLASVDIGGTRVLAFRPEDHLRLLALHLLKHGAWRALWLCDVAAAVETRPADFDWDYLGRGDPRRNRQTACALGLARDLLGARLDDVPPAWKPELPRWLAPTVLEEWGRAREAHGRREPISPSLFLQTGSFDALRLRWPNAVEATVGVRGPFNNLPRLPFQVGDGVRRAWRFARSAMLHPGRAR